MISSVIISFPRRNNNSAVGLIIHPAGHHPLWRSSLLVTQAMKEVPSVINVLPAHTSIQAWGSALAISTC